MPHATGQRPGHALWAASPLKEAVCRGILVRRGRNFWPVPFSAPILRPTPQDRGQDTRSQQPAPWKKPFALESYLAAVGNFSLCLFGPLQRAPRHRTGRPGHVLWAASPLKEAICRGILLRRGRNFGRRPFFGLYNAPHATGQRPDTRSGQPAPWKKQFAVETYYAAIGILTCAFLSPYIAPHATGQRPRHALSAASPLKETICSGILPRRGRNF